MRLGIVILLCAKRRDNFRSRAFATPQTRVNKQLGFSLLQLLTGNNNPYTEKEQIFDPAIVATKIRFIPYTSHMRIVCMRVELYGCPWTGE